MKHLDKKIVSFTIDKNIISDFNLKCKIKCINKSMLIQSFIETWLIGEKMFETSNKK